VPGVTEIGETSEANVFQRLPEETKRKAAEKANNKDKAAKMNNGQFLKPKRIHN